MKDLLFMVSVYRQGERIYPIIPELSKYFNVSILLTHQMNFKMDWNGPNDIRKDFLKKYNDYFFRIYDDWTDVDYTKFDVIIFDDSRDKGTEIPTKIIYSIAKKNGTTVFGNQHGNNIHSKSYEIDHYKKVFDYCFLFGKFEKDIFSKYVDTNTYLLGGIPSNDTLKNYKKTNEYILVITNFLENERRVFPTVFGDKLVKDINLYDLQKKYNKKVVVKIKNRHPNWGSGNPYQTDINFVQSVLDRNNIDGRVIRDVDDDNLMIAKAHSVISSPSTLCFKSIQLGIPTVILNGGGHTGAYGDFYGFCKVGDDIANNLDVQMELGRDLNYINEHINGGVEYNSTNAYITELLGVIEL